MAIFRSGDKELTVVAEVANALSRIGVDYERWDADSARVPAGASESEILAAYRPEIDVLNARGGYVTADVIDVSPATAGLGAMLAKFDKEHTHSEDEVRFVVEGRGIFYFADEAGSVVHVEMHPGDLIRVPAGAPHWFTLCEEKRIRAIRLFRDPAGWVAEYTGR